MTIIIQNKINMNIEAARYLYNIANKIDINETISDMCQNSTLSTKDINERTKYLKQLSIKVARIDINRDIIDYVFEQIDDLDISIVQVLFGSLIENEDYSSYILNSNVDVLENDFAINYFYMQTDANPYLQKYNNGLSFIDIVNSDQHISIKTKAKITYIYQNIKEILKVINDDIQKVRSIISEDYLKYAKQQALSFKIIRDEIESKGTKYLKECCHIDFDNYQQIYVMQSPILLNAINIQIPTSSIGYISFGDLVGPTIDARGDKENQLDLPSFYKVLADTSKSEIIRLLKNDRLYANELAQRLNVTPATISHHMNTLINLNLVKVEKHLNRFYYSLNKDEIDKYLLEINKSLI